MKQLKAKYYNLFKSQLIDNCIPFWLNNAPDTKHGGIYNCLDRTGKIYSTDKSVWMQGRTLWTLSYLSNSMGKDEKYLKIARSCMDFLNKYCIDNDGRMFFTVTEDGKPLRKRRYWFSESFYIVGCAEYFIATGEVSALNNAKEYFNFVYGIYKNAETDPYKITPKSYVQTRSTKDLARPMILLNTASIMRRADTENEKYYTDIITSLIEDVKCFYRPELNCMLESIGEDNSFMSNVSEGRVINPGHSIECAWFLLDEAVKRKDKDLIDFTKKVFDCSMDKGWDEKFGGILYFKDIFGHPVQAYEHDMKLWWPHNEAIIAALSLYKTTGETKYKDWFEKITEYAFAHFLDNEYGEWFGYLRRDGMPTEPPCKGHTYKGPFHVPRMYIKVCNIFDDKNI